jgi:hypothetical protein
MGSRLLRCVSLFLAQFGVPSTRAKVCTGGKTELVQAYGDFYFWTAIGHFCEKSPNSRDRKAALTHRLVGSFASSAREFLNLRQSQAT